MSLFRVSWRMRSLNSTPKLHLRLLSTASGAETTPVELAYDLHISDQCKANPDTCKPPILFLHGLFGSKANNRTISKRLASDLSRPVYALDLRNHGASPHTQPHSYPGLAADVRHFIDRHALHNPTLIGHSMGAKAAMTLALQHPALIRNLIAVDNAPVDAALKTDFHAYAAGMLEVARRAPRNRADADAILRPWAEDIAVRQFLLTNLVPTKDPEGRIVMTWRVPLADLARQLDAMGDFPPFDPDKTRFEGPMLIVRGTKSPYVADETLPVLGRFFPRFELVDVEAGHWLISENPEGFRQAVVEFLEDKD